MVQWPNLSEKRYSQYIPFKERYDTVEWHMWMIRLSDICICAFKQMLKTFKQMLNVFVHLNKCIWFSHKCCPKTCVISGEQTAPHSWLHSIIYKSINLEAQVYLWQILRYLHFRATTPHLAVTNGLLNFFHGTANLKKTATGRFIPELVQATVTNFTILHRAQEL